MYRLLAFVYETILGLLFYAIAIAFSFYYFRERVEIFKAL